MEKYLQQEIDILMLSCHDWANTCYRFSKCLEQIGLKAIVLKGNGHIFGYPKQAEVVSSLKNKTCDHPFIVPIGDNDILLELMKKTKVINFHASTYVHNKNFDYGDKNIVVTHGGHTYRHSPASSNNIFNKICKATVIQCPDLLNLGAINEHLVYYPVDTDFIQPNFSFSEPGKLVVGHYPSNSGAKGTDSLKVCCNELLTNKPELANRYKLSFSTTHQSWENNIKRMQRCDVYIEALNLILRGNTYGEWGNTCIEAAACGCIVITHCLSKEIYREQYGVDLPILIANSYEDVQQHLERLAAMSDEEVLQLKYKFRDWVEKYHNFKSTGVRLWNKIYKPLFPDRELDLERSIIVMKNKMTQLDEKYQTCLVTGGAGFIGSHICEELLQQGRTVKCMDNFVNGKMENIAPFLQDPKFRLITGSVTDILAKPELLDEFKGVDIVFHEACGKCTVCLVDPKLDLEVNAWGSYNVFEACRLNGVSKVIHASTGSVYGEPQYYPEDEKHPYKPASFYGVSKLAGERYLEVFSKLYGLKYSILRYFHVYGTRQDSADLGGVIPIFIRNVLKNQPIQIYGDGSQLRSFTYVKDIVKANFMCANSEEASGECYNVASGLQTTILELANKIKNIAEKDDNTIEFNPWRAGDIKYFDVSNEKIRGLGWLPNLELETNLKELIEWYRIYLKAS